jgi:hypothetical protein
MASNFGYRPVSFAYPYGAYKPELFGILKKAGLINAVTTVEGAHESNQNIYEISRLRPGYRVGDELVYFLENETKTAEAQLQKFRN